MSIEMSIDDPLENLSAENYFRDKTTATSAKAAAAAEKVAEKERKIFARELERGRVAEEKRLLRANKEAEKAAKKKPVSNARDDTDSLYSDEPTAIVGKNHRELTTKFRQYKQLFADNDQIRKFKIKKNATEADLQLALDEMDSIVNTSSIDDFLTDAILTCIKVVEGISARSTNYNVSGLSEMLKSNKEFNNLTRQILIKHKVFAAVPPETQLIFIVITSAYICTAKNAKKGQINAYLDEPVS